ncbi:MAG: hypothetical protein AAGG75_07840 [Bacteroidota bacterium]
MHDIEPHFHWRDRYVASEDERSPFYGRQYDEFRFTQKIYNYFIHPQWDNFGSATLYIKILMVDYEEGFAVMELIGEWNDCLHNDVMFLKREIVDQMLPYGIYKYVLICENVLNFHNSDDCYYEEWYEEVSDEGGWICFVNTQDHVAEEFFEMQIHHYVNFGERFNDINWRRQKPKMLVQALDQLVHGGQKLLTY